LSRCDLDPERRVVRHLPGPPLLVQGGAGCGLGATPFRIGFRHALVIDSQICLSEDVGIQVDQPAANDAKPRILHAHVDLIVVVIVFGADLVAVDDRGYVEAPVFEGFHRLVFGADDVEIAKQDVVLDSAVPVLLLFAGLVLAVGEELNQTLDFGDAPLQLRFVRLAVVDMHGAQAEAEPARLKRHQKGTSRELLFDRLLGDAAVCAVSCGLGFLWRHDELAVRYTTSPATFRGQTFLVL
jgi:hypothetical protein